MGVCFLSVLVRQIGHTAGQRAAKGLSGQGLKEQDLLINAEAVQDHHQVLAAAGDLALHGQAEVLLDAFGDAASDRVVPEVSDRETEGDHGENSSTAQSYLGRNQPASQLSEVTHLHQIYKEKL